MKTSFAAERRPNGGLFMFSRSSGILLHLSSLPGPYGIGTMGKYARSYVDFLADSGQKYWQLLPLVPTGEGNSPYMSPSSAAGNPWFIDPDELSAMGLLTPEDLAAACCGNSDRVDYSAISATRAPLLRAAFSRADAALRKKSSDFSRAHADWLPDYALFMACHDHFQCAFPNWPDKALIHRQPEALEHWRDVLSEDIAYHTFLQYLFFLQWSQLKEYANQRGIRIIGDIPFYVSGDSVDVWAHNALFQVDINGNANRMAGVPPDLFSDVGQFWGNPLYQWENHAADDYQWWCNRIRQSMAFYDVIRIDHFRGFDSYWEIPKSAKTAIEGCWRKGPGNDLLDAIHAAVPEVEFIAEDLGDLTESAYRFIQASGLPGLRVLTDAFNDLNGSSSFLPHHCIPDSVIYTGTHDTPTFVGWLFEQASEAQRQYAIQYLRLREDEGFGWGVIAGAWGSVCNLAMAPLQDVLGLGNDARMNLPGTSGDGNWSWRVRAEAFNPSVSQHLYFLTKLYGRL